MQPIIVNFTQYTKGDDEIAAIEVILQVMAYYNLNNGERVRVLQYLLSRTPNAQGSVATKLKIAIQLTNK
jgi:hypothetical protein